MYVGISQVLTVSSHRNEHINSWIGWFLTTTMGLFFHIWVVDSTQLERARSIAN